MNDYAENSESHMQLLPCQYCSRKFAAESIARHSKICEKTSKKRPVFDSGKQRQIGEGIPDQLKSRAQKKDPAPASKLSKASSWRQQHNDFINTVRAARATTVAIKEGKPLPPPPAPTVNPDYVQCPHCQRRFNANAAERHIPFCAEQHKRLATKHNSAATNNSQAMMRSAARQHYRPPLPHTTKYQTKDFKSSSAGPSSIHGRAAFAHNSSPKYKKESDYDALKPSASPVKSASALRSSGKPKKMNREWDSTVDSAMQNLSRTKTGLKPVGLQRNMSDKAPRSQQNQKAPIRKIASKGASSDQHQYKPHPQRKSSFRDRQNQWSSDSDNIDSDHGDYNLQKPGPYYASVNKIVSHGSNSASATSTNQLHSNGLASDFYFHGSAKRNEGLSCVLEKSDESGRQHANQDHNSRSHSKAGNRTSNANDGVNQTKKSWFCHECGCRYPITQAKFCCECGTRRIVL